MKSTAAVFALVLLASVLALRPAGAATASALFGVSATVQVSCQAAAPAMAVRSNTGAAANATSPVSVTCSKSAPYNVSLNAGMASSATAAIREMTGSGPALLGFVLGSNPRGIVNGGQAVGTDTVAGPGNRSARVLAEHYLIAAGQYAETGAYADAIIVTVTY